MELCEYGCQKEALFVLKNGKHCCSKSCNGCPSIKKKNSAAAKLNRKNGICNYNKNRYKCCFCNHETNKANVNKHEQYCDKNPINLKHCKNCNEVFGNYRNVEYCSVSCSTSFRNKLKVGDLNPNFKGDSYRHICFSNHKKECVVCGESNIVAVHHIDENHDNNVPSNLIPLCPTHHHYVHSQFKYLVADKINEYIKNFMGSTSFDRDKEIISSFRRA